MCVCVCRAEIALTDGRLMAVTKELNMTAAEEEAMRSILNDLEGELRDINATVAFKRQLLDDYLTSGFTGTNQVIKVKTYHFRILPWCFNDGQCVIGTV